jgi:sec-independent protein translocase protein TatA
MIEHTQYILAIFGAFSHWELLVVLVIALLIFGRRLPDIARSMGKSLTEFKKGINEAKETKDEFVNDVKEIGDDVAKEAKSAAGLDETEDSMS